MFDLSSDKYVMLFITGDAGFNFTEDHVGLKVTSNYRKSGNWLYDEDSNRLGMIDLDEETMTVDVLEVDSTAKNLVSKTMNLVNSDGSDINDGIFDSMAVAFPNMYYSKMYTFHAISDDFSNYKFCVHTIDVTGDDGSNFASVCKTRSDLGGALVSCQ
eukprot:TRINITY_DN12550_c0_g4_i2.p1 TRINITY_DN12550_c0_g4~~TRINITY_DN12550_c0_g4_i2.p1  ORF type:complete len:175 (+),score=58.84 TRINITY_DN12550_c0_g4_i2:53-526(+)